MFFVSNMREVIEELWQLRASRLPTRGAPRSRTPADTGDAVRYLVNT